MKRIILKTIPHRGQRYETPGDYWEDDGDYSEGNHQPTVNFRVSDMGNPDYEFLVLVHELVEWYLVTKRGIKEEAITEFDKKFEQLRDMCPSIIGDQEPGDMTSAPYHKEHVFATWVEKALSAELGVDWGKYDKKVNSLSQ